MTVLEPLSFVLACNKVNHLISDATDFGLDPIIHFVVTFPYATEMFLPINL